MTTLGRISLCAAALAFASPVAAQVRDFNSAADMYGRGVHAFFEGRTAEAERLFSLALADSPSDPRILYFRAMTLLRLGRSEEARGDMSVGAALEARQPNRYAVGAALTRVQGSDRLLLESFRQQARARAADNKRPPLDHPSDEEAGVLRSRVVIPLDELTRPGGPRPLTAEEISRRAAAIEAYRAAASVAPPSESAAPDADPFREGRAAQPPAAAEIITPPQRPVTTESAESAPAETTFDEAAAEDSPAAREASDEAPAESDQDPFGDLE